jgi:predicted metal-dependent peptidase
MNIRAIRQKLLEDYPNFGSVINGIKITVKDEPRLKHLTVHTDGTEIFINKATFDDFSDEEQIFHIAKNVCHIAFKHIQRGEAKEDKKLWTIAASAVVNQLLAQDGYTVPDGMVKIKNAEKFTVEEVYEKLLEKNVNTNNFNTTDYDKWYPYIKRMKKFVNEMFGKGEKRQIDRLHPEKIKRQNAEQPKGEQQKAEQQDDGKRPEESTDEREFQKTEHWKNDLNNMRKEIDSKDAGTGAGNKLMQFDKIGTAEKVVNWKKLLRAALETDEEAWGHKFSIKQNGWASRIEDREIDEKILTEVAVDTSGSVSNELLHSFLSQLKTLIKDSDLKVGCFDDKFYGFSVIKSVKDIDNFTIQGRGGTDFNKAVEAFSKKADNKIVFTDGCASMPREKVKAIWIVYGDSKISPAGGTVIMASESQIMGIKELEKSIH